VVDFGLVKDLERGTDVSVTQGMIAGTPLYLSPEAITSPEAMDGRSDLYSLGAVGYFALTGSRLFDGKTAVEVCASHLHEPPEPPSRRIGRAVPADLEAVLMECLAKEPAKRPASAAELCRRLEACASFGLWTAEKASDWWQKHGASARAPSRKLAGEGASDALTVTRVPSDEDA
jgi:serine/threonine-protein kinase